MDTYTVSQQQDAHEFLLKTIQQIQCDSKYVSQYAVEYFMLRLQSLTLAEFHYSL